MDILIGMGIMLAWLVLWVLGAFIDLSFFRWFRRGLEAGFLKILIAALFGFIGFVLVTPKIEMVHQKIIVAVLVLIFTGILIFKLKARDQRTK